MRNRGRNEGDDGFVCIPLISSPLVFVVAVIICLGFLICCLDYLVLEIEPVASHMLSTTEPQPLLDLFLSFPTFSLPCSVGWQSTSPEAP
jgi:hypothetical protein